MGTNRYSHSTSILSLIVLHVTADKQSARELLIFFAFSDLDRTYTYQATDQDSPLAFSVKRLPPEELVPYAVNWFLIQLDHYLLPGSLHRPKQPPLPLKDLDALLETGFALFNHIPDTSLPEPPEKEVNDFVDRFLPLVKQTVPVLKDLTRADAFIRYHTETLLLRCLRAISSTFFPGNATTNLQEEEPEIPRSELAPASTQVHDESQDNSFPERPTSLQSSASYPAIAAAESAFTEHQKSQASQFVHEVD